MTWKDKLEIGLKDDAPFRKDNLPDEQVHGPLRPAGPGRSPEVPEAREEAEAKAKKGPPQTEGEPTTIDPDEQERERARRSNQR